LLSAFARSRRANISTIFALSLIPLAVAGGAAVDIGRSMVVHARLAEALDAAGLAVGASSGLTQTQMLALAQQDVYANYTASSSFGTPTSVQMSISGQSVTLTSTVPMPTVLMKVVGVNTVTVAASSTVVWGQSKLRVSLVLDNTGSMTETDSTGTSKISALKTATIQLLGTLQNAAANAGDVEVAIIPFSRGVNVGTSNVSASWISWTDWESQPANGTPSSSIGPGSTCPYSTTTTGYRCQSTPSNGSSSTSTIPSSGSYTGYICPGIDNGAFNSGRLNRYYNGCYNSIGTTTTSTSSNTTTTVTNLCSKKTTCTTATYCGGYPTHTTSTSGNTTTVTDTTCSCYSDGGPSKKSCDATATAVATTTSTTTAAPYTHTWIVNSHSTWGGCVMDRDQDYDTQNTTPSSSSTYFPAENSTSCVPTVMMGTLSYDWTSLQSEVNSMTAGGTTNQTIGLAWGWQALTQGSPLNAPSTTSDMQQIIILLSDGLNTQDRWYGDGSAQSTQVDSRMSTACTNVKAAGFIVYTVYVDLAGTQGNSTVLQNCATDSSHYFDLTTSGAIISTFSQIAQQITHLRVAQ
jgi:Flp pilus assembly protein TadG